MNQSSPGKGRTSRRLLSLLSLALASIVLAAGCAARSRTQATQSWSGVAADGQWAYVGTKAGQLIALRTDTGTPGATYKAPKPDQSQGFPAFYATPTLASGRVFIGAFNGVVYSLKQPDLTDLQTFEIDGNALAKGIAGNIVAAGNRLVFGAAEEANSGRVYVIDPTTMKEVCRYPSKGTSPIGKVWSTPLVVGNTVYVGDLSHHLHAFSIDDCHAIWSAPADLGGSIMGTPLAMNGRLYVGSFDGNFYEVDPQTGVARMLFSGANWFWASPVTDGHLIFAANADGKVYAYDPSSGKLAWTAEPSTLQPIMSTPAVVGSDLVVGSDSGDLTAFHLSDGSVDWTQHIGGQIRASITVNGTVVYVHTVDGKVVAIDTTSEQQVWSRDLNTVS